MKGQMSEAELHFIKARLRGGVLSKARRGELITPLPVGLVYDAAGHVVLDPDAAVQKAVAHLFATFTATGSAFGCVKAFHDAQLNFPWRHVQRTTQRRAGLETAATPHRVARAAQPPIRRRLQLRPAPPAQTARRTLGHHPAAA